MSEYEKLLGLKDGKIVKEEPGNGENHGSGDNELATLLKTLTGRLEKLEATKTAETRRAKFDAAIEKMPQGIKKAYGRLALESYSEEDFANYISGQLGKAFNNNKSLSEEWLFKRSRLINVTTRDMGRKDFNKWFKNIWERKK